MVEEGNTAEVGWDGEELMEDGEVVVDAVLRKKKDESMIIRKEELD